MRHLPKSEHESKTFEDFMKDFVVAQESRGIEFRPFAFFNRVGDMLEVGLHAGDPVAHFLSPNLTVHRDSNDDKILGFNICGLSKYPGLSWLRCNDIEALALIMSERLRQDERWGQQNHGPYKWLAIINEELGEFSQAVLDTEYGGKNGGMGNVEKELVQFVAVGIAILQCLQRFKEAGKSWITDSI